jgi:hypothetical protein
VSNACATGATALRTAIMAIKAGECDMGLAVGVEKLAGAGLLGGAGGQAKSDGTSGAVGPLRRGRPTDGRIGTDTMPGVFAQVGMEYGHKYGGTDFELFAKISEKNHATPRSTRSPPTPSDDARADHGRHHDRLPEHPADVLGQLRRRRRRGGRQRREAQDAVARAAAPGGEGVGVGAHQRPVAGGLPGAARRQHAHPQRRQQAYEQAGVGPTTSTSSSCTTASPPPSWSTTTT